MAAKRLDTETFGSKTYMEEEDVDDYNYNDNNNCSCPDILFADDDTFEHFYYLTLFTSSMNSTEVSNDNSKFNYNNFKIQALFSGEKLLEALKKILECGCKKLKLIISDYFMGKDKMNGVKVCKSVRDMGYDGYTLLRTSETKTSLHSKHEDLDEMINKDIISRFLMKKDLKATKELILKCVTK